MNPAKVHKLFFYMTIFSVIEYFLFLYTLWRFESFIGTAHLNSLENTVRSAVLLKFRVYCKFTSVTRCNTAEPLRRPDARPGSPLFYSPPKTAH
jgi:hypothetical protein